MKPVLGTDSEWEEFCFSKCNFGDILGGCVASAAIEDASKRFMNKEAQDALLHNIYMDDITLLKYNDSGGGCSSLIQEVDQGLKRAQLPVKGWVETFDSSSEVLVLYVSSRSGLLFSKTYS